MNRFLPIKKGGWVFHMCSVVMGEGGAPNGAWGCTIHWSAMHRHKLEVNLHAVAFGRETVLPTTLLNIAVIKYSESNSKLELTRISMVKGD